MRVYERFEPRGYGGVQHPGTLYKGAEVLLRREAGNRKDKNATRILCEGESCGWVPHELAAKIAVHIDRGSRVDICVVDDYDDIIVLEVEYPLHTKRS